MFGSHRLLLARHIGPLTRVFNQMELFFFLFLLPPFFVPLLLLLLLRGWVVGEGGVFLFGWLVGWLIQQGYLSLLFHF